MLGGCHWFTCLVRLMLHCSTLYLHNGVLGFQFQHTCLRAYCGLIQNFMLQFLLMWFCIANEWQNGIPGVFLRTMNAR
jgi:hypothetical protein